MEGWYTGGSNIGCRGDRLNREEAVMWDAERLKREGRMRKKNESRRGRKNIGWRQRGVLSHFAVGTWVITVGEETQVASPANRVNSCAFQQNFEFTAMVTSKYFKTTILRNEMGEYMLWVTGKSSGWQTTYFKYISMWHAKKPFCHCLVLAKYRYTFKYCYFLLFWDESSASQLQGSANKRPNRPSSTAFVWGTGA